MSRLTASRAAFDLIASFEGFRTRAVLAPDGQWTLGFGHTATAREGLTVTRSEAEDLLRWDLLPIEDALRQIALTPLSQSQFDALISFAFNIGLDNFRASEVLKYLNQGQPVAAALSMHAWRRANVNGRVLTIDALVRRRAAESAMFLETIGARPAAPTSIIRPQIDQNAALSSHLPNVSPVETDAGDSDGDQNIEAGVVGAEPSAAAPAAAVVVAETTFQETLSQGPIVRPAPVIAPISPSTDAVVASAMLPSLQSSLTPIVPQGLSPFPGTPVYTPANGTQEETATPANDGLKTRLHNSPEVLDIPTDPVATPTNSSVSRADRYSLLVWGLMVLGAALLAFGLYFSWMSGLLTVATPRRDPTSSELSALLAAASGFIILVTSGVAALTGKQDDG